MALLNELVLEVCKHLANHDLKACRLVSKSWSHHASEYLFSKIYISPRKEDIEVFNLITQHPQLSHCVRRLEYDGTSFSPSYSDKDYLRHLLAQATEYSNLYRTDLNSTDLQYTRFLKSCSETSATLIAAGQEFSTHAFIVEGHREWKDRDEYQQRTVKNGNFLQTLTRGLHRLDLLNAVEVCNAWHTMTLSDYRRKWSDKRTKDLSEPYFYGSPFGPVWGLSHPKPCSWNRRAHHAEGFATGREEFQIITTALSQSQRHIRLFRISPLPVSIFESNITEPLLNHIINAYSGLEDLTLGLHEDNELTEVSVEYKRLPDLHALLGSMSGLRRLSLTLPHNKWDGNALLNCRQIFPTNGTQWMRLNALYIQALLTSAKDLLNLLTVKMPNLRELYLSQVTLLEGRWEGVIESLKTSMKLLSFPLDQFSRLRHLDGEDFLHGSGDNEEITVFCTNIETYVVSGGRHPCLCPDEDASASRKYLLELGL